MVGQGRNLGVQEYGKPFKRSLFDRACMIPQKVLQGPEDYGSQLKNGEETI